MLLKKTLKPGEVNEVNQVGQFIKIMNCENTIRIRASRKGNEVVTTDAKAGFELSAFEVFDQLTLTSEVEQDIEVWVSKHKLNYDALSSKANRSNSFVVDHFGFSQQLVSYDSAQSRLTIVSDVDWWLGGENVDITNGIHVQANKKHIHDSAAPISAYIDIAPAKIPDLDDMNVVDYPINVNSHSIRKIDDNLVYFGGIQSWILDVRTSTFENIDVPDDKRIAGPMFYSLGEISAILRGLSEGTFLGAYFDGGFGYSPLPIQSTFVALSAAEIDGVIYIAGAENATGNRSKIYTINPNVADFDLKEFDTNIKDGAALTIDNIFVDEVTGEIWITEEMNVYKGTVALNDFEFVCEINGVRNTEPTFDADFVIFNSKGDSETLNSCTVIHRAYGAMTTEQAFGQSFNLVYIKERLILGYNANGVYSAVGNQPMTRISEYNNDIDKTASIAAMQLNDKLHLFSMGNFSVRNALIIGLETDKTMPRAKFRVFKESF